jgi:hypothetical protein
VVTYFFEAVLANYYLWIYLNLLLLFINSSIKKYKVQPKNELICNNYIQKNRPLSLDNEGFPAYSTQKSGYITKRARLKTV